MQIFTHSWVLLQKNARLKLRSKMTTLLEFLLPILIVGLLIGFFWMLVGIQSSGQEDAKYSADFLPPISSKDFNKDDGKLLYAPSGVPDVECLINKIRVLAPHRQIQGFETEDKLLDYTARYYFKRFDYWAGLVFALSEDQQATGRFYTNESHVVDYAIRMKTQFKGFPSTSTMYSSVDSNKDAPERSYAKSGFVTLQVTVDSLLVGMASYYSRHPQETAPACPLNTTQSDELVPALQMYTQRFPSWGGQDSMDSEAFRADVRGSFIQYVAGVWLVAAALFPFYRLLTEMVAEKETRIREAMKMMGLSVPAYWATWFLTAMVMSFGTTALNAALIHWSLLFEYSDISMLIVLYVLFCCSLIPFCFFLSVFIPRAKMAGPIATVLIAGLAVAGIFVYVKDVPTVGQFFLSLFSPIAFGVGTFLIVDKEKNEAALTWDSDDGSKFIGILWMLGADTILYTILAWYADQVYPSEFGVTRPFYFPFQPSYWKSFFTGKTQSRDSYSFDEEASLLSTRADTEETLEEELIPDVEPSKLTPLLSVRQLRKVYANGTVAVHGLDLDIYQGQITALLGHNGAGKTTTIHMLTGLLPPTAGDALIAGHSIRTEMDEVRKQLGVCPQHDIIWENLTVYEHLALFATLKGVSHRKKDAEVKDMIAQLGLEEKTNAQAASLSGGQKRKLCVGIALIGDSPIVFLDEPTSGMDPAARRFVWDLLQRNRRSRAIILTTHFMDEADLLGDRIAIVSKGRLRCAGSSLFLKSKFGIGYVLTMVKAKNCSVEGVRKFVEEHVPSAKFLSHVAQELAFRLPREAVDHFPQLFQQLEEKSQELGIDSYGVSLTTLEEVFLRIAQEGTEGRQETNVEIGASLLERKYETDNEDEQSAYEEPQKAIPEKSKQFESTMHVTAQTPSIIQQFRALYMKRARIALRDYKAFIFQVVIPLVFLVGGVFVLRELKQDPSEQHSLLLSWNMFGATNEMPWTIGLNSTLQTNSTAYSILHHVTTGFNQSDWRTRFPEVPESQFTTFIKDSASTAAGAFLFNSIQIINSTFTINFTNLWNPDTVHALPSYVNAFDEALLRYMVNSDDYAIRVTNYPFPQPDSFLFLANAQINYGFIFLIAFAILPAGAAIFIVQERSINAKHLQHANGAGKIIYWLTTLAWDMSVYFLTIIGSMIVLLSAQSDYYATWDAAGMTFLLFFSYGLVSFPLTYVLSFMFKKHYLAQGAISVIFMLPGFIAFIAIVSVTLSTGGNTDTGTGAGDLPSMIVNRVFNGISPLYCLTVGLLIIEDFLGMRYDVGLPKDASLFELGLCGQSLIYLAGHAALWMTVLIVIDMWQEIKGFLCCCCMGQSQADERTYMPINEGKEDSLAIDEEDGISNGAESEDVDVYEERMRVLNDRSSSSDALRILNLRQIFKASWEKSGKKVAVDDLCLGIPRGECFGLLGSNGAGKTTTLRMLSGDLRPSSGDAFVNGASVVTSIRAAQRNIGFCPQFDALLDSLTGREHLEMYARLKGVPNSLVADTVQGFIDMMDIGVHADKLAGGYSGGNKRRLSLAIALIGNPPVIYLDEPSTGMDPQARRFMWNLISRIRENRAIILTTHSMEECDALCTRIGIMKQGRLVCLGTSQHLKSRYGTGYHIEIKVKDHEGREKEEDRPTMEVFMRDHFPGSLLLEQHASKYHYELPEEGEYRYHLAAIFAKLQEHKEELQIEDYSVSQPTLEQIFLKLTKEEGDSDDEPRRRKKSWCCGLCCCFRCCCK